MSKHILKLFLKQMFWIIVQVIILLAIGIGLSEIKGYSIKDVIFVEGIIVIILALFTSMQGNPMGLSIQSMGQNNAQINSNNNIKIKEIEEKKTKNKVRSTLN
ncbi:hypothetical protein HMPREF1084_02244 [Clostridium butyricum 60E.3]|uniref:hypothetical protein n=2 Tax=Clostridiaceae TaxID=31979 RepID=UPI0002D1FFB5|nr:hypothetical protein [Clostridium butyricum]ENZ32897.1 hypothetical protein HMPREF1084_02244 [Clostridium butyricum 60E.3]